MVVFTCNACGESVKKAQVEKHVNICRNCQCLSCMDCGKDFWGDDYKEHVKCVSEDQKYGGKDFEAKTNKGDAKQQEWIQRIHEVMKKPNISPKVRNILEQMRVFDNIPRKKAKFQNWMKNSLRISDSTLQDQVWDIFSEATRNKISSEKEQDKPKQQEGRQSAETGEKAMAEENGITNDKIEKKKNKRERKEERQKNKKKEKKDLKLENQSEVKKSKKSKKGKESLENELEINGNDHQTEIEEETNVKKRKHKHAEEEPHITRKRMKTESISEDMETENTNGNEENVGTDKGKFNWKGTIKAVLKQAPDNEISIKKLRKKVIAQYYAVAGEHHKSEEDILVIFNKKGKAAPSAFQFFPNDLADIEEINASLLMVTSGSIASQMINLTEKLLTPHLSDLSVTLRTNDRTESIRARMDLKKEDLAPTLGHEATKTTSEKLSPVVYMGRSSKMQHALQSS